jgi:O-antigen ligase
MTLSKVLLQRLIICLALGIVVVSQLLVASNPDGALPAIPELISVAIFSGILYVAFGLETKLQSSDWSFRWSECVALGLLWLTVWFVTGPRAFLSLFYTPKQVWIPCSILPGLAPKLECLLQASITQNYGYRTFFMLVTALLLGTLAFLIARSIRQGWMLLLGAVVFGPVLVTGVGLFCIAFGIEQALPKILLHNLFGNQRFTQIFGNPGWVWPYFAPGLGIALWATVAVSSRAGRIFWTGISVVLLLGVLATQQRGALLLCILYLAIYAIYGLNRGFKKRSITILALGGTAIAVLGSGLYSVLNHQKLLQESARSIGYDWQSNPLLLDAPRLEIWKAAWTIFKEAPLFGHGYASWFQLISDYGQRHNMKHIFDTAHNLFLQMLVELGLLHTFLVVSMLVLIALIAFQNSRFLPERTLLFLLAMGSFFVPTMVQEIDYIRPTFYIHATFWGTLAGLPFYNDILPPPSRFWQRDRILRHDLFSGKAQFIASLGFALLTGTSVLGILFCSLYFSFGGQPFTAYLTQPNPKIMRWLSPSVTLASFATAERKAYSIYESIPLQKPMSAHFGNQVGGFRLTVDSIDELALALENGGRYWPRRHHLSFTPAYPDNARWISVAAFYPPQQSNLGITWSRNMYPWENPGGRAGRWCGADCVFVAKSCGRRDRIDFAVQAPRPDYSEVQPLPFNISIYSFTKGGEFSTDIWQNQYLPAPIAKMREQLKKPGEEKQFHFKGTSQTAWYVVHLQTESVFNPKARGLSQDDRNLALFVSEVDCQAIR